MRACVESESRIMTRSAYATTSSLSVECPLLAFDLVRRQISCGAAIGEPCRTYMNTQLIAGREIKRCHSARAKATADKRTAEVNPGLVDTFEIPPEVPLPPKHPEPRTLAHHKVRA